MDQPSVLNSIDTALTSIDTAAPPGPSVSGYVDRVEGLSIDGWLCDVDHLERRLTVDVCVGGKTIGSAQADGFRSDLVAAGIGDGQYGFSIYIQPRESSAGPVEAQVRVRESGTLLTLNNRTSFHLDPTVFLSSIAADLVNNCNLRCPFCVVDYSGVTKTELMTEETLVSLLRLIRSVPEAGFWLSCPHEPTLNPRLNEFIELIPRDCRKKVWFTTNLARPLKQEVFEGWAHSGLHHINVSLDSMNPELFAVLRKFGRYHVFEANLNLLAKVFKSVPDARKMRYITMAFRSNLEEIPRIVEHSNQHWLASENEIRYTYNVAHITDQFRTDHYLHREDWPTLTASLQPLPNNYVIVHPPDDGYEETIQPSANYFELSKIAMPKDRPLFTHPPTLRARPDGTLMVANLERQFGVNIRTLEDPAAYLRQL